MNLRGYTTLQDVARKSGIKYKTLWVRYDRADIPKKKLGSMNLIRTRDVRKIATKTAGNA